MARIHLVHWNETDAQAVIERLRAAGHDVGYRAKADSSTLRELRSAPPDAVVVDLSRLPSHGREFAVALRASKATRYVPIVFLEGDPAKVPLPDAVFATGKDLLKALKRAIANPPVDPVVPVQMMDRYASRTAAQKLGIREGDSVAVVDAPRDYVRVLGEMPARVAFEEEDCANCAVTLWFVHNPDEYRAALPRMRGAAAHGKLWALWRKQKGREKQAVTERLVRETALDFGLVDYKICSVDATWSGLLFAIPRLKRS
jgi:hypothetical protein